MRDLYRERDRQWERVDARHQHHLSTSNALCAVAFTGCLDAPSEIPAGACRSANLFGADGPLGQVADVVFAVRGQSLESVESRRLFAKRLIGEMHAERTPQAKGVHQ